MYNFNQAEVCINYISAALKPSIFHISYFKHIYTGYKFNKDIVLQFGPVKIKKPNKLFTNKLIDKNIYIHLATISNIQN